MFALPTYEPSVVNPEYYFSHLNLNCNTKPIYRWRQHKLHTCRKCQVHGVITSLKGHINCPHNNCTCVQCSHISTLRVEAVIRKRRRKLVRLEETHHANIQTFFNIPSVTATQVRPTILSENIHISSLQNKNIATFRAELVNASSDENQALPIPRVNEVMNLVQQSSSHIQQASQSSNVQLSYPDLISLFYLVNYLQQSFSMN